MNFLLINGSSHKNGATSRALCEAHAILAGLGADTVYYNTDAKPRYACSGCGGCASENGCIYRDIDDLISLAASSDGIIIASPTHYGSAPGSLISVLSRLIYSSKNSVKNKPVTIIGIGRRGCLLGAIETIQRFFEFASCPIISGVYPQILYASDFKSAEIDLEGLQNIRSATRNLFYVSSCIKIAKEHGILPPEEEKKIKTDISTLQRQ